ncbi:MAG: helix-hairpin-helix domain-containing protein [Prevotella sp.]|nr:helix-hairpin-helix domain-containing protein [Prevotella sp.]
MNRSDRKIALGALAIAVLALTGVWMADNHENTTTTDSSSPDARYTRSSRSAGSSRPVRYYAAESRKVERFPFDPNTADSTQLLRLGLQPWQVRNIYKYRARGGIYRRKEDFARLYGLTVKQYRELEPYIRISDDYQPAATLVNRQAQQEPSPSEPRYERDTLRYPVKIKEDEHIVLNTADTTQLKKVPGIGTYYAKEIMCYGQWLGGYVSVDQLDEIEGFPQESKKYFVIQDPHPKKLNINRMKLLQLRRHPYINYFQAKEITEYRRLHGNIASLQELSFSRDFPPEAIKRLEPYVEY